MNSFRVCLAAPSDYPHSACFAELARLLWLSVRDCGYDCDFAVNEPDPGRVNLLIGYHLLPYAEPWDRVRTVVWQLEQLDDSPGQWNPRRSDHLRHALRVWDFSPGNIAFLDKKGIAARLLVPGHHPDMRTIRPRSEPDLDILFYGSLGPRRRAILDRLSESFRLQALFGVYGAERDAWIARSRLVLNLHHYPVQLFESVRVSHLLSNRIAVISETGADLPWPDIGLLTLPYEQLVDGCRRLLEDENALNRLRHDNHRLFSRRYPMSGLLAPLLEECR